MEIENNALLIAGVIVIGFIAFLGFMVMTQAGTINTYKTEASDNNILLDNALIDYNALQLSANDLNVQYNTLATAFSNISSAYTTLQTQSSTLSTQLTAANDNAAALNGQITTLTGTNTSLNTQIAGLNLDKNILQIKVNDINNTLQVDLNIGRKVNIAFNNCYWGTMCLIDTNGCRNKYGQFADLNYVSITAIQSCKDTNKVDMNTFVVFS